MSTSPRHQRSAISGRASFVVYSPALLSSHHAHRSGIARRHSALRSTALAGGVLAALLAASPALAQNATWLAAPGSNDFNTGANWSTGVVPTGTATFGATGTPALSVTGNFNPGGFTFIAGAPAYTFTFAINQGHGLTGAGIVNGRNQTFVVNSSQFQFANASTAGEASFTVNAGLRFLNTSTAGASIITTNGGGFNGNGTGFEATSSGGTSTHIIGTNGLLYIDNYGGAGVTIGSLEGLGTVAIGGKTLTIGSNDKSTTYSGVIQNLGRFVNATTAGNLVKTGTGTLTLAGTNAYTGTTMVNGGTLLVNGSIATSSGLTVNNGGTVGGTGTLPGTTIATGGTLAPGNNGIGTLRINGGLTLNAGSTTQIEVQAATIDRINVTGAAALAGTVRFAALGGTYLFNSPYTFLQAGSITGTFGTKAEQGSFGEGVTTAVSYTGTEARLTLTPAPLAAVVAAAPAVVAPAPAAPEPAAIPAAQPTTQQPFAAQQRGTGNQFSVASALDRAVANGANVDAFFRLYNQNRAGVLAGLDQISGTAHSGAPALGAQAATGFLGAMLNPVAPGRSAPTGGLISAYAPTVSTDWSSGQRAINRAIGADTVPAASFRPAPRYSTWATVTGGTGRVGGETSTGSSRQTSNVGGLTAGVDLRVAPDTIIGAALSGATGSTTSANGLGKVDTSLFQLGLYGSTRIGALSLAASGSWITGSAQSSRAIPVLGQSNVTSKYDLSGLSGRLEAAWAAANFAGISAAPYVAYQAASIRNGSFVEANEATGAQVGVAGAAKTNITARAELGLKLESERQIGTMPAMVFARFGWGRYTRQDAEMTAQLIGVPGSAFTVTGTRPERNVALLSAGGEVRLTSAVSVGARVDAELGSRTQAVSGTANVRWAF